MKYGAANGMYAPFFFSAVVTDRIPQGDAFVLSLWGECEHRRRLVAGKADPCRCCSAGRSPAPTFRNGVRYEKQKTRHPHQRTRPRCHPPKSKHGKSVHYGLADIVRAQAELFINDLINKLRELMIDLRTGKAVFVGGGSILLKKYTEASDKIGCPIFIEEISANTKGYELLYKAQG